MPSFACKRFSASSFGTKRHLPLAASVSRFSISATSFPAGIEGHEQADLLHARDVASEVAEVV